MGKVSGGDYESDLRRHKMRWEEMEMEAEMGLDDRRMIP